MRHMDFSNAPKVWRTVGPGMRVRVVCPKWLAAQTQPRRKQGSAHALVARICAALGVTVDDVKSDTRGGAALRARRAVCYWLRRRTSMSYPAIARMLGGRHHTAVMNLVRTYPEYRARHGRHLDVVAGK